MSTLPPRCRGALRQDLPCRIGRKVSVPVTVVHLERLTSPRSSTRPRAMTMSVSIVRSSLTSLTGCDGESRCPGRFGSSLSRLPVVVRTLGLMPGEYRRCRSHGYDSLIAGEPGVAHVGQIVRLGRHHSLPRQFQPLRRHRCSRSACRATAQLLHPELRPAPRPPPQQDLSPGATIEFVATEFAFARRRSSPRHVHRSPGEQGTMVHDITFDKAIRRRRGRRDREFAFEVPAVGSGASARSRTRTPGWRASSDRRHARRPSGRATATPASAHRRGRPDAPPYEWRIRGRRTGARAPGSRSRPVGPPTAATSSRSRSWSRRS